MLPAMALPPRILPPPTPPQAGYVVVRPFDPPAQRWDGGHRGIDLGVEPGALVTSLTSGTVAFVGQVGGIPIVTVRLPDARRVTYQPIAPAVALGDLVDRGSVLGRVPAAGAQGASHCGAMAGCIHIGLRDATSYWDPSTLLRPEPPVLKPY
jgi:murein DD-endopeptidase MepM/ murein hydrolase activator NlpD